MLIKKISDLISSKCRFHFTAIRPPTMMRTLLALVLAADISLVVQAHGKTLTPLSADLSLIDRSKMGFTSAGKMKPNLSADEATTNATSTGSWAYYAQCDSRWANQELGWCSEYTIW